MIGAWVAVRTDDELDEVFHPSLCRHLTPSDEDLLVKLYRLLAKGVVFDNEKWARKMLVSCLTNQSRTSIWLSGQHGFHNLNTHHYTPFRNHSTVPGATPLSLRPTDAQGELSTSPLQRPNISQSLTSITSLLPMLLSGVLSSPRALCQRYPLPQRPAYVNTSRTSIK